MKPRSEWTAEVAALTALHREKRARALLRRGAALALERRRGFRTGGKVGRSHRGRPQGSVPADSAWHTARALTKRRLFEKIEECGEGAALELVCKNRGCKKKFTVPLGCGQAFFCHECRKRRAHAFRIDFKRKQLGLVSAANRAGLLKRFRRRVVGGRFAERLLTLTVPHTNEHGVALSLEDRVTTLRNTWERFWRLFRDELRGRLRGLKSGITIDNSPIGLPLPRGKAPPRPELDLFDLVSYLRVFEWTPGDDGKGHPHYHVWLFSPFLEIGWLRSLWSRAYADTTRPKLVCPVLVVDVRATHNCEGGSIANELVKYLTKEWHLTADGAKRVDADVFARLYALLDGTRVRQSSAGLSHWTVPKEKACPCCAYSSQRGHWASVYVVNADEPDLTPRGEHPEFPAVPTTGVAPRTRSGELRETWDAQREREWRSSADRVLLDRKLRRELGLPSDTVAPLPKWQQRRLPL